MVLGGHVVTLIPVCLPAAADWEASAVIQRYFARFFIAMSVCRRNISYIIVEVHALDISGVLCKNSLQAVVSFTVIIIVDTAKFSFELCSDILKFKILVHVDIAPVRDRDRFCSLSKN